MSPEREAALITVLDQLVEQATAARNAKDTAQLRRELTATWFAVHAAQEACNAIEAETREDALAQLKRKAA